MVEASAADDAKLLCGASRRGGNLALLAACEISSGSAEKYLCISPEYSSVLPCLRRWARPSLHALRNDMEVISLGECAAKAMTSLCLVIKDELFNLNIEFHKVVGELLAALPSYEQVVAC